jgi:hypothetical protein
VSARRCPHKPERGPALDGLLWCNRCDAETIRGYIVADTLDRPTDESDKSPWTVTVESIGEHSFRTVFRVGVQGFTIAYDDSEEAEQHCHGIARMFRNAMSRAGLSRETLLNQALRDIGSARLLADSLWEPETAVWKAIYNAIAARDEQWLEILNIRRSHDTR